MQEMLKISLHLMFTLLLRCDTVWLQRLGLGLCMRVCVFQPYVHSCLSLFASCCLHCCSAVTCRWTTPPFVCLLMYFSHMWAPSEDILVSVCHFKLPAMSASELIAETVTILWLTARGQRPSLAEITSVKVQGGLPKGPRAALRPAESRPSCFLYCQPVLWRASSFIPLCLHSSYLRSKRLGYCIALQWSPLAY